MRRELVLTAALGTTLVFCLGAGLARGDSEDPNPIGGSFDGDGVYLSKVAGPDGPPPGNVWQLGEKPQNVPWTYLAVDGSDRDLVTVMSPNFLGSYDPDLGQRTWVQASVLAEQKAFDAWHDAETGQDGQDGKVGWVEFRLPPAWAAKLGADDVVMQNGTGLGPELVAMHSMRLQATRAVDPPADPGTLSHNPEPGTLVLLGSGALLLALATKKLKPVN